MSDSPRVTRYRQVLPDDELDQIINIPPKTVSLHGKDGDKLAEQLDSALRAFFQSDRQIRKIVRYFLSTAQAHAETHLATDSGYVRGLYSDRPWGEPKREVEVVSTRYSLESRREQDGRYWAAVPSLPGVFAHGENEGEVKAKVCALALRALAERLESHDTKVHSFIFHVDA